MKQRYWSAAHPSPTEPRAKSDKLAIEYLLAHGIPALPGKAVSFAHVNVVAFGCVPIEVKCSIARPPYAPHFRFTATPTQIKRGGFLAEIVMLICEYESHRRTYHLFPANHPVFYINGHLKTGFEFWPGVMEATKNKNTCVVMTQPLMDQFEDHIGLIEDALANHIASLKTEHAI